MMTVKSLLRILSPPPPLFLPFPHSFSLSHSLSFQDKQINTLKKKMAPEKWESAIQNKKRGQENKKTFVKVGAIAH